MLVRLLPLIKVNIPENGGRQLLYSIVFTVLVHLVLLAILFANINWKTDKPKEKPLEVVFSTTKTEKFNPQKKITIPKAVKPSKPKKQAEAIPETKPKPKPVQKSKPKPKPKPEHVPKPKPKPKPETKAKVEKKVEPKPKPVQKSKPNPVPKPKPKVEVDLLEQLINRSTENAEQESPPETPQLSEKANVPDTANTTNATSEAANNVIFERAYKRSIETSIRSKVNVPSDVLGNPSVLVEIEQNEKGEVLSVRVIDKSKSLAFDEAVIRAVYAASPLPLPSKTGVFQNKIRLKWKKFK